VTPLDPVHAPTRTGLPAHTETPGRLGAVVLAGGTAARMGGVDKAGIELDGVTLLERALAATMTAFEVVVVGDQVPTTRPVTWTIEDPRGGGPAAGLLTGLGCFLRPPQLVQVLAVDMPRVTAGTFARLGEALAAPPGEPPYDGALLVDEGGRRQSLCAVYRRSALLAAAPPEADGWHGLPIHHLLEPLRLRDVPALAGEQRDIDTWADLRDFRGQCDEVRDAEPHVD
jgi:molybdopterin-guanine dinucleotide biosynthesis protein A